MARRDHFTKIKDQVLSPLKDSIGKLVVGYFRPSESFYVGFYFTDDDRDRTPPREELTLIPGPAPVAIQNVGLGLESTRIEYFDQLLFDDLGNHFPHLKSEIDRIEKLLKSEGAEFSRTRWELARNIWFDICPKIDQKKHNMSDVVKASLLIASETPTGYWPNLSLGLPQDGTLDSIKNTLKIPGIAPLVKDFVLMQKKLGDELSMLLKSVSVVLESERELPGHCQYL